MSKSGFKFEIQRTCVEDYHSGEEWGDWRTEYDNSLIRVSQDPKYPDVVCNLDFKEGDKAYAVWLEYSTGDSFGHGTRSAVEAVGLFKDHSCAKTLQKALESFSPDSNTTDWKNKYRFTHTTSDGQYFEFGFAPWCGYFEHLDNVHIEEVIIT